MGRVEYETTQVDVSGLEGALTVGTTAVEIKVGATIKDYRQSVSLFNNSTVNMYWGYTSSVTTSTGTPIYPNQFVNWEVEISTTLYVVAGTASNDARITEVS